MKNVEDNVGTPIFAMYEFAVSYYNSYLELECKLKNFRLASASQMYVLYTCCLHICCKKNKND